jgi:hypothetical protein
MKRLLTNAPLVKRLLPTALAALCLCAVSAPIATAKSGLFGVVMTPDLAAQPLSVLNPQMGAMASHGVQAVRTGFDWETTEPTAGHYDWTEPDNIVTAAASHGLLLLPIVEFTPRWASSHPSSAWDEYAPTSPQLYANFMTALVQRYGPAGSFWKSHPSLRKDPIRSWQIWNEPEGTKYDWRSTPWPKTYTALLKAAYKAVHAADRHAQVVTGALVGLAGPGLLPWLEASALYKAGFKHYFDVVAVNAFTYDPSVANSVSQSLKVVQKVRAVMKAHHDGAKPVWVTEFTWTAARSYNVPHKYYDGFETTSKGQAARLAAYYTRVATQHPDNIKRAFWFDWASPYIPTPVSPGGDVTFQYSGLLKWQPGTAFTQLPLLRAYARVAHKYANR